MKQLVFLASVVLELYLLIRLGGVIGALGAALWCIVSAMLGVWTIKTQSMAVLGRMQADLAAGRAPEASVSDAVLVLLSGLLLILPGLITDALGLLLLIPFFRRRAGGDFFRRQAQAGGKGGAGRVLYFFSGVPGARGGFTAGRHTFGSGASDTFDASSSCSSPRQAVIIDSEPIEGTPAYDAVNDRRSTSASGRTSPHTGPDATADSRPAAEEVIFDCEAEPTNER